ncbi:MAG: flagellin [Planctomycetota bacterium]
MQPIGLPFGPGAGQTGPGLRMLSANLADRNTALERLSTGLRINRGSDDPAGLIASEGLGAALAALEAETRALERSQAVVDTASGALGEISGLLIEAEGLAVQSANTAGLSDAEREALQVELDSIVRSVDRIIGQASFNDQKLLDGRFVVPAGDQTYAVGDLSSSGFGEVVLDPEVPGGASTRVAFSDLKSGGTASLLENPELAQQVIAAARDTVLYEQAALGNLGRNVLGPRLASIATEIETLSASRSLIRDADVAEEASRLIRANIRTEATLFSLSSQLSNQEQVLDLLG